MAKSLIDLSRSLDDFITGTNSTAAHGLGSRGAKKIHEQDSLFEERNIESLITRHWCRSIIA